MTGSARGGQAVHLDAWTPPIRDRRWRRTAEGSSLEWDPEQGMIAYAPPPGARRATGWSLHVGPKSRDLRAIVHVHGSWPDQVLGAAIADFEIDTFVFLDGEGRRMAPGLDTGAAEYFAGWFEPARVQDLARVAGVAFREDEVIDWADVNARYPGLVQGGASRGHITQASVWVFGLMAAAAAVMAVVLGVVAVSTGTPAVLLPDLVLVAMAVLFVYQARQLRRGAGRRHKPTPHGSGRI